MNNANIDQQIEMLVAEEHRLLEHTGGGHPDPAAHERLRQVKVQLDQLWDLLRQRRAHTEFGRDPEDASLRSPDTVENYRQ